MTKRKRCDFTTLIVLTTNPYLVRQFDLTRVASPPIAEAEAWLKSSNAALDLEIGCGVGWHPIRYARENPERRLIAIEHTRAKFERFRSRLLAHPELSNLFPVHADAIRWIANHLQANSIELCFLLYPNPEPKAPNRRWLRSPFMHHLLKAIKPGGVLALASNERWYIDEACEWAERFWKRDSPLIKEINASTTPAHQARTHFEKKYLLRGQTCFDVQWHIRKGNKENA